MVSPRKENPRGSCLPGLRSRGDSARGRGARRPFIKYTYRFGGGTADGDRTMKAVLGGKGAGLAEMSLLGLKVPAGSTITTEVCELYSAALASNEPDAVPKALAPIWDEVRQGIAHVERAMGRRFTREGVKQKAPSKNAPPPLLVSVRSGAAASMPGMMDTVLNLGMNDDVLESMLSSPPGGVSSVAHERFALDAYRRLLDMFGGVVLGLPHEAFESKLAARKRAAGCQLDTELGVDELRALVADYKTVYAEHGAAFPSDPETQLRMAIEAVFASWENPRAKKYREINRLTGLRGTAVNVQAMVYGNMGEDSGSGVCFTRDPSTGEKTLYGEYLLNSQGEDVVAGIRTPIPVASLKKEPRAGLAECYANLQEACDVLEHHFGDVMDVEFTIERGELFILQCRAGKRTGRGALRVAREMVREGLCTKPQALATVEPAHVQQLLHPRFDPADTINDQTDVIARGLPASPGAAVGAIALTAEAAEAAARRGEAVVLVREETAADDVGGMHAARGVLTARGGMTSHAAVVARGWGKPCVVGCGSMRVDEPNGRVEFLKEGKTRAVLRVGDVISVDGETGAVVKRAVRLAAPPSANDDKDLAEVLAWADEYRTLKVLANADSGEDAAAAFDAGAEGIGLARTEHMFLSTPERTRAIRRMVLAVDAASREKAMAELLAFQRSDFADIFRAARGKPVTIRLLDPPLHEFLPPQSEMARFAAEFARESGASAAKILERADAMRERNPMLGLRGCRLGVTRPDVTAMQARAIFEAALDSRVATGVEPDARVMVPLVSVPAEFAHQRRVVEEALEKVLVARGEDARLSCKIGLMIETPRAAVVAARFVEAGAEFFSFGTNDLTQMTLGLSRDDAGAILARYLADGIFPADPFQTVDEEGVGVLVEACAARGRAASTTLEMGVCGEHGGDPKSVAFFDKIGLEYVSCSPFRVVGARLAAARAAVARSGLDSR